MNPVDKLQKKEDNIKRTVQIDQDLYEKLQSLSDNVYNDSISKIVNVAIENTLSKSKNIKTYRKPKEIDSIYRSILFRKSLLEQLLSIREETGLSFARIINGCIKDFLEDYKDELK